MTMAIEARSIPTRIILTWDVQGRFQGGDVTQRGYLHDTVTGREAVRADGTTPLAPAWELPVEPIAGTLQPGALLANVMPEVHATLILSAAEMQAQRDAQAARAESYRQQAAASGVIVTG